MYKKISIINTFIFFLILASCSGQKKDIDSCDYSFSRAKKYVAQYAAKSELNLLHSALASLDTALTCNNTRPKSINLAITIYFLSKDYEKGKLFIESLRTEDFNLSYQKNMYSQLFQASNLEHMGDSTSSKLVYQNLAYEIEKNLTTQSDTNTVREILNNLVFIESKFKSQTEIESHLNSIKFIIPNQAEYIDSLLPLYFD